MKVQSMDGDVRGFRPDRMQVDEWLRQQTLGVISTVDEHGVPSGATVAFSVTEDSELIIGTSADSRKSRHVDITPDVGFTVTDPEQRYTVQLQGFATKLAQKVFELYYTEEHYRQRPESLPFRDEPGQTHIMVTPYYLRFSDCNPHPWVVTEYNH